jgi:glucosamine-phosphate N-acetyltransferase
MNIFSIKDFPDKREYLFSLLSQLTSAPLITEKSYNNIINKLDDNHNIFVYVLDNKIVGMITLLHEQKLIHNGLKIVHIEDLVVDKEYKNRGIGRDLINYCLDKISKEEYYKIILDCSEELERFYNKFGFEKKNIQMAKYL